jgi:8-hydroxy-5-deazaflavin:NADPH oxidoreductase
VVKTLNHIGYHELESDLLPPQSPNRRALVVASDDADAAATVMEMIDRFGFDPVFSGPLISGVAVQPGTVIFGGPLTADDIRRELEGALISVPAA